MVPTFLKVIFVSAFAISFASFPSAQLSEARAQQQQVVWTDQEKPILEQIRTLRKFITEERTRKTKELALQIRQLPAGMNKVRLAFGPPSLSTEGDSGQDTLQEVATTLSRALREHPLPATPNGPPFTLRRTRAARAVRTRKRSFGRPAICQRGSAAGRGRCAAPAGRLFLSRPAGANVEFKGIARQGGTGEFLGPPGARRAAVKCLISKPCISSSRTKDSLYWVFPTKTPEK
jgi:hypothetical protein